MEAYGQDVEIVRSLIIDNDTTLNAGKPYLVYDSSLSDRCYVDFGCRYQHILSHIGLIVYGNLRLQVHGNSNFMQGDRLDKIHYDPIPYKYVAGQWGGCSVQTVIMC